jgi:GNAT superfamily N-acetyltransferase
MPRQPAHIRDATPEDAPALLTLWSDCLRSGEVSDQAHADARQSLANLAADPDARLLVAEADERIVAALQVVRAPISPLTLETVVHTSYLVVSPEYRKHGYGHALMEAAVTWAEEKGVDQITSVTDTNRDTNRFLARLGLGTLGTVRFASTAVLRRKLSGERGRPAATGTNRHLVEVLAQRRSLRRLQDRG